MQNKAIIITGAASGIGAATAGRMVREGARVILADRDSKAGAALAEQLGPERARFVATDVTDADAVHRLFEQAAEFAGVDAVFNNAGIAHQAPAVDYTPADWQRVIDVNLTGVFLVAREAMQRMQRSGGSIVNCASILGHVGQSQTAAYSATKGAVLNLTRTLALEGAPRGIRVNSVSPGYIDTPLLSELPEQMRQFLTSLHPLGRLGQAEEVASAVLFLASDEASFTTGADLLVDGGFTAGKA